MDVLSLAAGSVGASRAQTQVQLVQAMNKINVDADRQIADMIAASAANARAITQGSATAPSVGTRLDRQV
jgi:hypothetical protein